MTIFLINSSFHRVSHPFFKNYFFPSTVIEWSKLDLILTHILLFGKASLDISANTLLLNATMNYIVSISRSEEGLF